MPEFDNPNPPPQQSPDQAQSWMFGAEAVAESAARGIVNETFDYYQGLRSRQETKWKAADELYYGVVPVRNWDGSNVVRSHVPNNISFDHVETALANIESIFDNPEWFSAEAMDGGDPTDARKVQAVLQYYLDLPDPDTYTTAIPEITHAIKGTFQYGTGFLKLEWINDRPRVRWVDLRSVYVPPTLSTPNLDGGANMLEKVDMTVEQLVDLAKRDSRIKIPSLAVLNTLAESPIPTVGDATRSYSTYARGVPISYPSDQWQPMPKNRMLEILIYTERTRVIWMLNRLFPIFQAENPYQTFPYVSSPCRIAYGTFYGIGLPESIKYPQRYSEALMNAHIDETHLAINPPKEMKRSQATIHSDQHTRPGKTWYSEDGKSMQQFNPPGVTLNILPLFQEMNKMAESRNGMGPLSTGGGARAGNINRTRAGVQAQTEGTSVRLKHMAQNIETYMLGPMLYKICRMIRYHTHPSDILIGSFTGENGKVYQPVRAEVFHKDIRFIIRCASKMLTRDRLGMLLEPTSRYLLNPQVQAGLAKQNKKINYDTYAEMVQDAGGLAKKYSLVVDMTPEEIQAQNAPPPEVQAGMAKQDKSDQTRTNVAQMKFQSDREDRQLQYAIAQMKHAPNPAEQQTKQQEAQTRMQEMMGRAQIERESAMARLEADRQSQAIKIQQKQDELNARRAELQQELQATQVNHQTRMAEHMMEIRMKQQEREQQREQNRQDWAQAQQQTTRVSKPTTPKADKVDKVDKVK